METPHVVLYSRPGCHLCDETREVIVAVRERVAFDLEEIDIDGSDELTREYGIRIPVVAVNGVEMWDYRVDRAEFEAAVRGT
jgi:glutaredoxin